MLVKTIHLADFCPGLEVKLYWHLDTYWNNRGTMVLKLEILCKNEANTFDRQQVMQQAMTTLQEMAVFNDAL